MNFLEIKLKKIMCSSFNDSISANIEDSNKNKYIDIIAIGKINQNLKEECFQQKQKDVSALVKSGNIYCG